MKIVVPRMPMVPSATATGVRVIISATSTRMKPRNPRSDCIAVVPRSLLAGGCAGRVRSHGRRLRPDPDEPHAAGQQELQGPDRADPVQMLELDGDDRETELIRLEHVDRHDKHVPE